MKTITFTTDAKTAHGKTLPTPLEYSVTYTEYESHAEVVSAKDDMTNDEILATRNAERKQAATAAARSAALEAAGIKKPDMKDDVQLQLQQVYKVYIAKGKSHDEARRLAAAAISEEWSD